MKNQIVISIGREYGSGGHEIGEMLARKMNLDFVDRSILDKIAESSNSSYEKLAKYDEKPKSFLSRTVRGYSNSPEINIAELQFALLKSKAVDGDSFIVIGRCSDEIFNDICPVISIFICADHKDRIQRIIKRRNINKYEAEKLIIKHDKSRAAYHDYFCKNKWGEAGTYNICINSSTFGITNTVNLLYEYIQNDFV